MISILENTDAEEDRIAASKTETTFLKPVAGDEPPQYELARFLDGLAMMGPQRRKDFIDTFWLQQWLCSHLHTLTLSDIIIVNRAIVRLGKAEPDYLKMLVEEFFVPEGEDG